MKIHNQEIEAYTNLLMKCVSDNDYFDEGLVQYLLNYKRDIIEGYYFLQKESFGVTKSNLWGYIKSKNYKDIATIEKWANILNIDINEKATYQYLKFNFYDRDKKDRRAEYKPFYFKGYGTTDKYLEVSEVFLNITSNNRYHIKLSAEDVSTLTETELKLIINDMLNDSNINGYGRLEKTEGLNALVEKIKNYLLNNYEEMERIAKEDKKSLLRVISMGDNIINGAFQSMSKEETQTFISKYNLEDKFLTYIRYKDISKSFLIHSLSNYKDKSFWIKNLNCYSKKTNKFSIKEAIKDFISIGNRLDEIYETQTHKIHDWDKTRFSNEVDAYWSKDKQNRILETLKFFKEELKGADNYKEEIEKLMIIAIVDKSEALYFTVKNFMKKENGDQEDMDFHTAIFKEVNNERKEFMTQMKKKEIEELNNKLSLNLEEKGIKEKKFKI